ncbi:MAG: hypothetical protein QOE70_3574 [Chthoniobacter sp.]|jgi:hypothetical protein|nr:hypothetical protein [Chthoniobacter sp.]
MPDIDPVPAAPRIETIAFDSGRQALLVSAEENTSPETILRALGIAPPAAAVLILGDEETLSREAERAVRERLSEAILPAIARSGTLVLERGLKTDLTTAVGELAAQQERRTTLLGVAVVGRASYPGMDPSDAPDAVDLEPHHSHFTLAPTPDAEADLLFSLGEHLAKSIPVIALVAGSSERTQEEALRAARLGWPVIVISGSGTLADDVAAELDSPRSIIKDGRCKLFPATGTADEFASLFTAGQRDASLLLTEAWHRYAKLDHNANLLQKRFRRLQFWILALGIIAVLLVAVQKQIEFGFGTPALPSAIAAEKDVPKREALEAELARRTKAIETLHWLILGMPILMSGLIAAAHSFRPGDRWVLLRGGAEAIKREIYRFRSGTGDYRPGGSEVRPADRLFEQISSVGQRLIRTEIGRVGLRRPRGEVLPFRERSGKVIDDGLSALEPERYLNLRLEDQLRFYGRRTGTFGRSIWWSTVTILFLGAVGTLLAAASGELWIPLTTTLAAAFASYLRYTQTEETLATYNHAEADLNDVKAWWDTLSPYEKGRGENYRKLVDLTEKVLEQETAGWSQRMTDTLDELHRKDDEGKEKESQP